MPEQSRHTLRYRVLRYTPNLVRDEWVNVGVLLEEIDGAAARRGARFIEEDAEIARVRGCGRSRKTRPPTCFSDPQNKKGSGPLLATALPGVCPRSV